MARDSSPFAQRLKALASRGGKASTDDTPEAGPVPEVGEPTPPTSPTAPEPSAEVDPDEQPTGEFPALAEPSPTSEVPFTGAESSQTPVEPPTPAEPTAAESEPSPADAASDEPGPADSDSRGEAPTPPDPGPAWPVVVPPPPVKPPTSVPAPGYTPPALPPKPITAVRPIWLDPPPLADEPADANADAPEPQDSTASNGPTLSPPVLPARHEPEPSAAASEPDAPEPSVAESEATAPDPVASEPDDATTVFPAVPVEPVADHTTVFEAIADESALEPISTDLHARAPEAESATAEPEPIVDTEAEAGTIDTESDASPAAIEPVEQPSTPEALNDALSLEDDANPTATAGATSEPPASTSDASRDERGESSDSPASSSTDEPLAAVDPGPTTESDTQATLVSDAVPEPPRRLRLLRPGFRKRAADDTVRGEVGSASVEPASVEPEPAPDPERESEAATSASTDDAVWDSVVAGSEPGTGASEPAADEGVNAPDPGSITGRIAAIGRLGRGRKQRKDEGADTSDASAPPADAEPVATEPAEPTVPDPALLTAEPVPYKPSFAERAALRRRAKSLRGRRDAGLLELGAIVLDQSRFGDPSSGTLVRRRTSELADLDSEIAAIEIALDDERSAETVKQLGVVHCASCSSLLGPADRFCANCGAANPGPGDDGGETSAS